MTTKLSVSLLDEDVAYLDRIAREERGGNRSAVIHDMVRLFREIRAEDHYARAFEEWEDSDDSSAWNSASGDGLNR